MMPDTQNLSRFKHVVISERKDNVGYRQKIYALSPVLFEESFGVISASLDLG